MNTTRRGPKLLALVAASALVFAACGSDDDGGSTGGGSTPSEGTTGTSDATDTTEGEAVEGAAGGTLIWAHEQEPPDLHLDDPENNLSIVSWIRSPILEGAYGISGCDRVLPGAARRRGRGHRERGRHRHHGVHAARRPHLERRRRPHRRRRQVHLRCHHGHRRRGRRGRTGLRVPPGQPGRLRGHHRPHGRQPDTVHHDGRRASTPATRVSSTRSTRATSSRPIRSRRRTSSTPRCASGSSLTARSSRRQAR